MCLGSVVSAYGGWERGIVFGRELGGVWVGCLLEKGDSVLGFSI